MRRYAYGAYAIPKTFTTNGVFPIQDNVALAMPLNAHPTIHYIQYAEEVWLTNMVLATYKKLDSCKQKITHCLFFYLLSILLFY